MLEPIDRVLKNMSFRVDMVAYTIGNVLKYANKRQ